MKTLLVHIPQITKRKREIMVMPMGLFAIADYLNNNGIEAKILHYGIEKELDKNFDLERYINKNNISILSFDLHWAKQTKYVLSVTKEIKHKKPETKIILGGMTASYFADEILRSKMGVDFVIRGDGEYPLLMLIKNLYKDEKDYHKIPNLSYIKYFHKNKNDRYRVFHNNTSFFTNSIFYNEISHSIFNYMLNYRHYIDKMLYADFDLSTPEGKRDSYQKAFFYNPGKGCPFNCIYCGSFFYKKNYINCNKGYYFFSLKKAYNDITNATRYGIETLRISFDPEPRREYYKNLFNKLKSLRLRLIFDCFTLPDELFIKSVAENFRQDSVLVISIETGSEIIRKKIRRPYFDNISLINTLKMIKKYRINAHIFLSFGLPYETLNNLEETRNIIKKIKDIKNIGITICPMILDIGSLLYEYPQRYGTRPLITSFEDIIQTNISDFRTYYSTALSEREIIDAINELNKVIYER